MKKISLKPCEGNRFQFIGMDFTKFLDENFAKQRAGKLEEAMDDRCNIATQLADCLLEDCSLELDSSDPNSRSAAEIMYISALDLYMNESWVLSAALLETIQEIDGEYYYNLPAILALCYILVEDEDCLDSIISDIEAKGAMNLFALAAIDFTKDGTISKDIAKELKKIPEFIECLNGDNKLWENYTEDSKYEAENVLTAALAQPILKALKGLKKAFLQLNNFHNGQI